MILIGGIVVVAVVVVGGVAALVLGGGGDSAADGGTPTAKNATPLPTTPTPTAVPATATSSPNAGAPTPTAVPATATVTGTPTAIPRTTILPRRFDDRRIEVLVARYVNQRRGAADLDPLEQNGSLARDVRVMARNHSVRMANRGEVTHVVGGNSSTDRYRDNELYRTCQWRSGLRSSIVRADNNGPQATENSLETIGRTYAGREYGDGQFNGDEAAVARAIVDEWWADDTFNTRLTLPNAGSIGVGVEITQTGQVYATADLCS